MATETAPRSATGTRRKPAREANSGSAPVLSITAINDKIAEQMTMVGMMVGQADPVAGFLIMVNVEDFAASWAKVAGANERVKRVLEKWFHGGVYAEAGMATAALAVPMLTHYKMLPRAWFNPTVASVEGVETLVTEEGKKLGDLLAMHAEAEQNRAAMMEMIRKAAQGKNGGEPDPDHYEADTPAADKS